mmetsp:Transcript_27112/g.41525  ORF Transcript_27112/g.41525 Transcript_27112/m.41525 type:complete len:103 (+) Transcript_27112:2512-2820(+)
MAELTEKWLHTKMKTQHPSSFHTKTLEVMRAFTQMFRLSFFQMDQSITVLEKVISPLIISGRTYPSTVTFTKSRGNRLTENSLLTPSHQTIAIVLSVFSKSC